MRGNRAAVRWAWTALAITTTPVLAADDRLPLKPGVYVSARTPCKGAPLSDVASYAGGKSGISSGPMQCDKATVMRDGGGFHLKQSCYDAQSDKDQAIEVTLSEVKPDRFTWDGTVYRYCGKKLQW